MGEADLPFFFLMPLWGLAWLIGLMLLAWRRTRFAGAMMLAMSTGAAFLSVLGAFAGVFCLGWLARASEINDAAAALAVGIGFLGGMAAGAVAGGASAGALTFLAWRRAWPRRQARAS